MLPFIAMAPPPWNVMALSVIRTLTVFTVAASAGAAAATTATEHRAAAVAAAIARYRRTRMFMYAPLRMVGAPEPVGRPLT